MEELKAHAESARLAIQEKRHMRGELQKKEAIVAEKLTESELRHSVGEYDESQWDQVHQDVLAELVSVREDLQSVEADIQKLEELDALVRNRPTPRAAPASPEPPPPRPPRPGPEPPPHQAAQGGGPALLKPLTEDGTGSAPAPPRARGPQFHP